MKKTYWKPMARKIDFQYDDQVVASSICKNYSLMSVENPERCWEELKDIPLARMYSDCYSTDKE